MARLQAGTPNLENVNACEGTMGESGRAMT